MNKLKENYSYILGDKSDLNLLGKVVFFPIALFIIVQFTLMETLFQKKEVS